MADSVEESIQKAAVTAEQEEHFMLLIDIYLDGYTSGYASALYSHTEYDMDGAIETAIDATQALERNENAREETIARIQNRLSRGKPLPSISMTVRI